MTLFSIFEELARQTTEQGTVTVREIPDRQNILLGMNSDGDALILFLDSGDSKPSRKLESITIDYGRTYSIVKESVVTNAKYSSVRLLRREFKLLESFCLLADALVKNISSQSDSAGIRIMIDDFVKLFERKNGSLRDRVKGLFGELLVIHESLNATKWIDAWHLDANSNKDFSFEDLYVEVKTSESKNRSHRIGLDQLTSTSKAVFIASVGILEDPTGASVFDLLNAVLSNNLDLERQAKLLKMFYETLGNEAADAKEFMFGPSELKPQIIILNASRLPRPEIPLGCYSDSVGDVSFSFSVERLLDLGFPSTNFEAISNGTYSPN